MSILEKLVALAVILGVGGIMLAGHVMLRSKIESTPAINEKLLPAKGIADAK